jgi:hypothetical protein
MTPMTMARGLRAMKPFYYILSLSVNTLLLLPDPIHVTRLKTGRGLAIGSERFIKKAERQLQRSLQCLPQGRPKKQ